MNSLLVGRNQIRGNVDFRKNLDEQRCGGGIVAVVEHRGSDIETFLWSGLSQLADEPDSIRGLHAPGVSRKRLRRDSPAGTVEAGLIQRVLRRCQKFLRFLNPLGIVARINFNKRSDSADPRSDLSRRSSGSIGSTRHNRATQNQNPFTHSSYLAEHGVGFHLDPSRSFLMLLDVSRMIASSCIREQSFDRAKTRFYGGSRQIRKCRWFRTSSVLESRWKKSLYDGRRSCRTKSRPHFCLHTIQQSSKVP